MHRFVLQLSAFSLSLSSVRPYLFFKETKFYLLMRKFIALVKSVNNYLYVRVNMRTFLAVSHRSIVKLLLLAQLNNIPLMKKGNAQNYLQIIRTSIGYCIRMSIIKIFKRFLLMSQREIIPYLYFIVSLFINLTYVISIKNNWLIFLLILVRY